MSWSKSHRQMGLSYLYSYEHGPFTFTSILTLFVSKILNCSYGQKESSKGTCSKQLFWRFPPKKCHISKKKVMESLKYFENLGRFLQIEKIPQYTLNIGVNIFINLTHSKCPPLRFAKYDLWHPNILDSTSHGFDHLKDN
jgi:hypothetical protein